MGTEGKHVLEYLLAQFLLVHLHLQTCRRYLLLTRRNTGYPTDFRVGMSSEIGFTSESFLLNMLHSLSHNLIVDGMVELEVIALHVQIDILGGWQFHIIAVSILHLDDFIAMMDYQFDEQVFHLHQFVERSDSRLSQCLLLHRIASISE